MEGRVLRAMEEAGERRGGRVWSRVPGWAAACAVLLVTMGVVLVSSLEHGRRIVGVERRSGLPAVVAERVGGGGRVVVAPRKRPLRREGRVAVVMPEEESLAMREMRAPSLVAPPEPLTEQEVLLRKMAHRGDSEEIAMLRPEVRAAREAEGLKEYEAFF